MFLTQGAGFLIDVSLLDSGSVFDGSREDATPRHSLSGLSLENVLNTKTLACIVSALSVATAGLLTISPTPPAAAASCTVETTLSTPDKAMVINHGCKYAQARLQRYYGGIITRYGNWALSEQISFTVTDNNGTYAGSAFRKMPVGSTTFGNWISYTSY